MRRALAVTATILFVLACGGGGASPAEDLPTEASLHERAESSAKAFTDGNWRDAYQYTSPRFREICPSENWGVLMETGMKALKNRIATGQDEPIEFSLIRVTTVRDTGRAHVELREQGRPIDRGPEYKGDRWVVADGEWWAESINWFAGCQLPNF